MRSWFRFSFGRNSQITFIAVLKEILDASVGSYRGSLARMKYCYKGKEALYVLYFPYPPREKRRHIPQYTVVSAIPRDLSLPLNLRFSRRSGRVCRPVAYLCVVDQSQGSHTGVVFCFTTRGRTEILGVPRAE